MTASLQSLVVGTLTLKHDGHDERHEQGDGHAREERSDGDDLERRNTRSEWRYGHMVGGRKHADGDGGVRHHEARVYRDREQERGGLTQGPARRNMTAAQGG